MALEDPVIAPEPQAAAAADGVPPRFACFVAGTDTVGIETTQGDYPKSARH